MLSLKQQKLLRLKILIMMMMEELLELLHTISHTNSSVDMTSIILVDMIAITTMENVHSKKDPQGHQEIVEKMEMMAQQVCLEVQVMMGLQEHQEVKEEQELRVHQEGQDHQEKIITINATEVEPKDKEVVLVEMVLQDDQGHLELADLKEMLACLHLGHLVNQVILEHLGEMEIMDGQDYQEDLETKDQRVRENISKEFFTSQYEKLSRIEEELQSSKCCKSTYYHY